mmetsp:Transcript_5213/g.18754  ORF Transcript_5213/g.18754 Transcript_5213/m.18754 type:complete len:835 (-) Transcript_5213:1635-4139(-)
MHQTMHARNRRPLSPRPPARPRPPVLAPRTPPPPRMTHSHRAAGLRLDEADDGLVDGHSGADRGRRLDHDAVDEVDLRRRAALHVCQHGRRVVPRAPRHVQHEAEVRHERAERGRRGRQLDVAAERAAQRLGQALRGRLHLAVQARQQRARLARLGDLAVGDAEQRRQRVDARVHRQLVHAHGRHLGRGGDLGWQARGVEQHRHVARGGRQRLDGRDDGGRAVAGVQHAARAEHRRGLRRRAEQHTTLAQHAAQRLHRADAVLQRHDDAVRRHHVGGEQCRGGGLAALDEHEHDVRAPRVGLDCAAGAAAAVRSRRHDRDARDGRRAAADGVKQQAVGGRSRRVLRPRREHAHVGLSGQLGRKERAHGAAADDRHARRRARRRDDREACRSGRSALRCHHRHSRGGCGALSSGRLVALHLDRCRVNGVEVAAIGRRHGVRRREAQRHSGGVVRRGLWQRLADGLVERAQRLGRHRIAMLGRRKGGLGDLARERRERRDGAAAQVVVCTHERRHAAAVQAEHVVRHEHLAGAALARADADGGDGEAARHERRDLARHHLEHDGHGARFLQCQRVVEQRRRGRRRAPLHRVTAQRGHRLRREADVAHDGDAGVRQRAHGRALRPAALQLHGVCATLLQRADARRHGLSRRRVRPERQVAHHERGAGTARGGAAVVHHVVHGDGYGVLVAEHHHPERVADQHNVDAGAVRERRHGCVVRSHHRDLLATAVLAGKRAHSDALASLRRLAAAAVGRLVAILAAAAAGRGGRRRGSRRRRRGAREGRQHRRRRARRAAGRRARRAAPRQGVHTDTTKQLGLHPVDARRGASRQHAAQHGG